MLLWMGLLLRLGPNVTQMDPVITLALSTHPNVHISRRKFTFAMVISIYFHLRLA